MIAVRCGALGHIPNHASPGDRPMIANPVEHRIEMIAELKEIKALLKQQNAILRSGNLKVVFVEPEKH